MNYSNLGAIIGGAKAGGSITPDPSVTPLRFTNTGNDEATISYSTNESFTSPLLYISKDGGKFKVWDFSAVSLLPNEYVEIVGNNENPISVADWRVVKFAMTGTISASGDLMSLVSYESKVTTIPASDFFVSLFKGCTSLKTAPILSATTLTSGCYKQMFQGSGITTAPELSATSVAENAYNSMFAECTDLTTIPSFNAISLGAYACQAMFSGCTSLTSLPNFSFTTLSNDSCVQMFYGCTSLSVVPTLPATSLPEGAYDQMFRDCIGITTVTSIAATSMQERSCRQMFEGCSSLSDITVSFVDWGVTTGAPNRSTEAWLKDVAASGTFKCPSSLDTTSRGENKVPMDWTVENI